MAGKIFKIKMGYNPNSSSIGSQVSLFLQGTALAAFLINMAMVIFSRFSGKSSDKKTEQETDLEQQK